MARIGLKYFRYGILNEETEKYGGSLQIGKAVDCKITIETNTAELYADDGLAESDYSVKKVNVAITVDESDDTTLAQLTGHTISQSGELVRKDTDVAPYVGFGRIITKVEEGEYKYKVEFLCKVKFKEALPDEKTKGESVEFTTTSLEGTALKLSDGTWSKTKTFTTYTDAVAYLESLLAVPTP